MNIPLLVLELTCKSLIRVNHFSLKTFGLYFTYWKFHYISDSSTAKHKYK